MEEQGGDYWGQAFTDIITKLRNLEEKQRMMKDRLLLIGQNLIELREKENESNLELRKNGERLSQDVKRLKDFMESVSSEFSKMARKEDIEILSKQARMFQPLELVTKSDLEKLKKD